MIRRERVVPYLAATVFAVSILAFAAAALYNISTQRKLSDRICESVVQTREGSRAGWQAAERFLYASQTTAEGRVRIRALFQEVLDEIPPLECRDRKPVEVK